MKIKSIQWRNIKSFGNKLQKLEFSEEGSLTMVLGKNGNGKSTLLDLPKALYYGKLDKFKKDDIANRLNKHGWIKGEIEINPKTMITIERKLSPQDLTVYKYNKGDEPSKDNDIGKSGASNYQDYIDIEVTGLPYHIFSNIISLSINDFKSFVSMTPHDKRIIIDKLFSMEILNRMNNLVKNDLREIKINIELFNKEISSLQESIKGAQRELEKLKLEFKEDNTKKKQDIANKIVEYKKKFENAKNRLKEYKDKEQDIKKSYNHFLQQKIEVNEKLKDVSKQIDLYKQDKCPTCETPFDDKRFVLLKENLYEQQKINKEKLTNIDNSEKKYSSVLNKVQEGISALNEFIANVKSSYNSIKSELEKLKIDKPKEFKSIQNIVSKNTSKIQKRENEKSGVDKKYKYISILEGLYSDAGVKRKILESYLPTLNKEVEFTLSELNFPYRLRFDNNFEPNLEHLGIKINEPTLSTGERKRVDLAVLISIIRMIKRKYPSLNIFMLDEVLSSIDGDGIHDILGLLQKTAKEMSINIFIVSQTPLPIEYFDLKIDVQKNDGFSDLEIEKLNNGD